MNFTTARTTSTKGKETELTAKITGAPITVHRELGPGFLDRLMKNPRPRTALRLNYNVPLLKGGLERVSL